jgi:hypothetical protein
MAGHRFMASKLLEMDSVDLHCGFGGSFSVNHQVAFVNWQWPGKTGL